MAINLLAIISIVFVFVIGAIVALFVLHFKKKKSPTQVATNAEDISNLQTNVASLTKKTDWGPWTISHTSDAFNICYNGETQLNLNKETSLPAGAQKGDKPGSGLSVQYMYSNQIQANKLGFPLNTFDGKTNLPGAHAYFQLKKGKPAVSTSVDVKVVPC